MEGLAALIILAVVGFAGWKIFNHVVDNHTRKNVSSLVKMIGLLFGLVTIFIAIKILK